MIPEHLRVGVDTLPHGTLVLVVGPSGAGKDSLIAGARLALAADGDFVFPRRFITRAADAGGEDHVALTQDEFAQRRAGSGFLLSWTAHGLDYGISSELARMLVEGRTVIVNVSRAVIDEARARYRPLVVIEVTAPLDILASRLAARGRETASDVAARLSRAVAERPTAPETVTLCNDGALAPAIARFVALLRSIRGHVAASPKG
jgi:ribose 1,5-bisphosphokinase